MSDMTDRGRVYKEVVCPYCGDRDWYSFHILSEALICNSCDNEFEIELEVKVNVKSTKMFEY